MLLDIGLGTFIKLALVQTSVLLQDHPQDYWQDADEDFWEDPVSSPDRASPSPAASPAKDTARHPSTDPIRVVQRAAVSYRDATIAAEPGHMAAPETQVVLAGRHAFEKAQPASSASQGIAEQDTLDVQYVASEPKQLQQATAGEELREQQQNRTDIEEATRTADPGHQVVVGEELKKQPSDVPVAYPMIVHAGAVPRPPSRQTSSEFLASIAGTSQSMRWVLPVHSPHPYTPVYVYLR